MSEGRLDRLEAGIGELRASQRGKVDLSALGHTYANDPAGFARDVLKVELWAKQVEMAEAVRDRPRVIVRGANATGKDAASAVLALWWAFARRGLAILQSATERQVRVALFGELARFFRRSQLPGDLYDLALRVPGAEGAGVIGYTASDVSRVQGLHHPRLFVVLSEAQRAEPWAFEGALAMATGGEARILAVLNPLVASGPAYTACRSPNWHSIRVPASEHPNVVQGREVIPGGVTREWIEAVAAEYGRGSGIFRSRVEAEFPQDDETEARLCKRAWIERAVALHESHALDEEAKDCRLVAALDVARFGADSSALCVRQGPVVRKVVTWHGSALLDTCDRARGELEAFDIRPRRRVRVSDEERALDWTRAAWRWDGGGGLLTVDAAGLGAGPAEKLKADGFDVREFNGGRAAIDERRYQNLRTEAFFALRTRLEAGRLALPRDSADRIADELTALRWNVLPSGKLALEPKDDLRARIGRSPDVSDALSMSLAIERVAVHPYSGVPVRWSA
jgi:hypothetical protein